MCMIKEMILLTVFMVMNTLVITGILLQTEQDLREKTRSNEKILLQSDEIEKRYLIPSEKIKSDSNRRPACEFGPLLTNIFFGSFNKDPLKNINPKQALNG